MTSSPASSARRSASVALPRLLLALGVLAVTAGAAEPAGEVVLAWNAALLEGVRCETTPPPLAARNLAIVHLALEDALACADAAAARGEAHRPAVVLAIAGCRAASSLCPGRAGAFEALREKLLGGIEPAPSAAEWTLGAHCADTALEARAADGASRSVTYIPHAGPGQWRRTPPWFRPPEMPQWAGVRAFALAQPEALRLPGPPALDSSEWREALDEIRRLGGRASTERTAEQALIARFWSDFSYTNTPPGHWNEIAAGIARERGLDERACARLFARLNVALADAAIVCWQAKYTHHFWRPVTALAAEGWQPMLNTPAHPEYPSGHSVFSGAAAAILADFFGGDACTFTVRSDGVPGAERTFTSFSAAAREISESRICGGIHFRFSCEDGLELGRAVSREILRREQAAMTMKTITEVATR